MQLGVLGPLLPPEVTRPAQKRLLSILLLHANSDIDRDTLIDRMWGESLPASAKNSLQVHVNGLRKHLPDDTIATTVHGYRIVAHPDSVAFTALVSEAEAARDSASRLELAGRALDLWRGPPFPELADDGFARPEISRLTELHLRVEEIRVEALIDLGRWDETIPQLRHLVGAHPLRERLRGLLMLALYRAGRQAEALREYQAVRQILGEELGIEPSPNLRELEERILLQDVSLGVPTMETPRTNLPASDTSFVGRDEDIRELQDELRRNHLVTIVGGPGFGKTRLAVELGRAALVGHPDGVWFVNLADTGTDEEVASQIITATHVQDELAGLEDVGRALAARHMLVILDNCEHVVEACSVFAAAALAAGGSLDIVATSRKALDVSGERVWHLQPLSVPRAAGSGIDPLEALSNPAVQLFIDRAKAVDRTFTVTPESAPTVVQLSRQLAGIPLAIELASRWVPALGIADITEMLDPTLGEGRDEDRPASTLRDAIQWSLALLPEEDRALAIHAAIFSGSFGLADAQAICSKERAGPAFAAMMSRVVSSSLLQAERRRDGSARYRMLVPIREFLRSLPEHAGRELQERFAKHYLTKSKNRQVDTFATLTGLAEIDDDLDNLRAALDIGFQFGWVEDVAAALGPMADYFHQRYMILESMSWHRRLLDQRLRPERECVALRVVAGARAVFGHLQESADLLSRAISVAATLDDKAPQARSLMTLSAVENRLGNWSVGLERAEEALSLAVDLDNQLAIASAEYYIGENLLDMGDFAAGRLAMLKCAESFIRAGEPSRGGYAETRVAIAATLTENPVLGREALDQAKALMMGSGSDFLRVKLLTTDALVAAFDGEAPRAASLILRAHGIIERSHDDDVFDVLLPATAVFASGSRWTDTATMLLGIRNLIGPSERAMPVPWDTAVESWAVESRDELGERYDWISDRARLATFDSLMRTALQGLSEVVAARPSTS